MATIRRLADSDVRSIFESLHNNRPPPSNLKFTIVPVGANGLKLSPPSIEFDDGLYVLLKPQKTKKSPPDLSKVPPHLKHLVMPVVPPNNCPWSLSGPQFPQPTAIQQRYCYPKGRQDYSSKKGGALWTMYGTDGKEDLEFRLLHVYFSAKRAVNRGSSNPTAINGVVSDDSHSPSAKRPKRSRQTATNRSNARGGRAGLATPFRTRKPPVVPATCAAVSAHTLTSPTITVSPNTASDSHCASPSESVGTLPPATFQFGYDHSPSSCHSGHALIDRVLMEHPLPPMNGHSFLRFSEAEYDDMFVSRRFHPIHSAGSFGFPALQHPGGANCLGVAKMPNHEDEMSIDDCDNQNDMFYLWNDPMLSLTTNHSFDHLDPPTTANPGGASAATSPGVVNFANHLDTLHNTIRESIRDAPAGDQGAMLSIFASWAKQAAKEPLGIIPEESISDATNGPDADEKKAAAPPMPQNKKG